MPNSGDVEGNDGKEQGNACTNNDDTPSPFRKFPHPLGFGGEFPYMETIINRDAKTIQILNADIAPRQAGYVAPESYTYTS